MARFIQDIKRTHSCGELTKADVGKEVVLFGWVNNRRDHGGAVFIDLRDRNGLTQVVFEPRFGDVLGCFRGDDVADLYHRRQMRVSSGDITGGNR